MKKIIFLLVFVIMALPLHADDLLSVSASRESSDIGEISSVHLSAILANPSSKIGIQVSTGLNFADILNYNDELHSYVAWDVILKFGYFSNLSIYVEGGFDLGEAIVEDVSGSDEDWEDDDFNSVDGFLGVGAGLILDNIGINLYARYRHLNGPYLDDTSDWFSGMEFSVYF